MDASPRPPAGLYRQLLGDSWESLSHAVQRLHGVNTSVQAVGVFRVRHGKHCLARVLARLAQLPAAGEAVAMQLLVTARHHGEEWRRTFAGRPLISQQCERANGALVERVGAVELQFCLRVVNGGLAYHSTTVALCLGSWRVPIPRYLSPRVTAVETPVGVGEQIDVAVAIHLPWLGCLLAYEGILTCVVGQP